VTGRPWRRRARLAGGVDRHE